LITINDVTKSYNNKLVLDHVSLNLKSGECFGLIGPNGAGKSTLMKIIVGIINSDSGSVSLHDEKSEHWKNKVGYVPQEITLQDTLTAEQNLATFGALYNLEKKFLQERMKEVLHDIGLYERRKEKVNTFSSGMKRRLHIGCALIHEPHIIIMDEPTTGIDPQSRQHIFELIHHLKEQQCTVLYSSHHIEEVEKICDHVAFIDHGNMLLTDSLRNIMDTYTSPSLYVQWEDEAAPAILKNWTDAAKQNDGWLIPTNSEKRLDLLATIIQDAQHRNANIKQLTFTQQSLEQIFFSITGKALRD